MVSIPAICFAKCENYYIIMLNSTDGHAGSLYEPIQKSNITWNITKLHKGRETIDFDMSCVLDLYCQNVTFTMTDDFEDDSSTAPTVIDMKTESTPKITTDTKISTTEDTEPAEETTTTESTITHKEDSPTPSDVETVTASSTIPISDEDTDATSIATKNVKKSSDLETTATTTTDIKISTVGENTSLTEEMPYTATTVTHKGDSPIPSDVETITANSTMTTGDEDTKAALFATKNVNSTSDLDTTATTTTDTKISTKGENASLTEEIPYTASTVPHKGDSPTPSDVETITAKSTIPITDEDTKAALFVTKSVNSTSDLETTATTTSDTKISTVGENTSSTEEIPDTASTATHKGDSSTPSEVETITANSTIPISDKDTEATSIAAKNDIDLSYLETITTEDVYSTDPNIINKENAELFGELDDVATTTETISDLHKYDPEKSKAVANKVMAGVVGALAAVGVCILVKFAANKVVEYCAHSGVYRLPDP
ncbi:mucin-5AC-like [Ostrinia furnacalis]|uniref:mucin-5AC-like n=1 Tax=Ostrinia furnacalis TaxID=93504 RepID=UPI00103AE99A|nr:mucin-5AC-like [Ostrinia furnacalis]